MDVMKQLLSRAMLHSPFFGAALLLLIIIGLTSYGCNQAEAKQEAAEKLATAVEIPSSLPWSERMAKSIIKLNPEAWMTDFREEPRWTYTNGLVLLAIFKVGEQSGNQAYIDYAKSYADTMIDAQGKIRDYNLADFNIDHVNAGKLLFPLYEATGDERYKTALFTLRKQLQWQPRTSEGGFWHKLIYPWQMWLDGLYMGAPFYAEFASTFNEPQEAFDDVARQFILMEKKALDPKTGLLYHGWDESKAQRWANPQTGQSPCIWGRAMGWYAMGLVDVLDHFPENHPKRKELLAILNHTASAIIKYQDEKTGLWYQVMDQGKREGNFLEATASSMFVYAFVKGFNKGYLSETYLNSAKKGYKGLIDNLIEVKDNGEVHLHKCCAVAGLGGKPYRDGSYEYYINEEMRSNDTKATGPFILASLEFESMGSLSKQ
jgi:unsaturated rhamnogalacturonyl hydrolase